MMNIRHQRSRRKGSKQPPGAIYVGRPTVFGNPFDFRTLGRARSVEMFAAWLDGTFRVPSVPSLDHKRTLLLAHIGSLSGHDLVCWCPLSSPCHADVLLTRANPTPATLPPAPGA